MMSVALKTPKNYNRIYLMNLGTKEEADWKPITVGIAATETEIEEESEDYYYMDGQGHARIGTCYPEDHSNLYRSPQIGRPCAGYGL